MRTLGLIVASCCAVAGAVWVALALHPQWQEARARAAQFAAFIPYGAVAWLIAAVLFAALPRTRWIRAIALPCTVGLALQLAWSAPYVPHAAPTASGSPLRVLSVNLNFGKGDAAQLARQVTSERPDVLVLVEVQQPIVDALTADGALAAYPYRVGNVPSGWSATGVESDEGTLVLSRTPITQLQRLATPNGQYVVRVDAATPVTLVAARPRNMLLGLQAWRADSAAVADAARPHLSEPLVLAGDFNAVREHITLQRLLDLGLRDAAEQSGAGWQPTYPTHDVLPPLLAIDHVLVNGRVTATAVRSFALDGTDHRGLVADLVVR